MKIALVVLAIISSCFAHNLNYPSIIEATTNTTARLSGFSQQELKEQIRQKIHFKFKRSKLGSTLKLQDPKEYSLEGLSHKAAEVCADFKFIPKESYCYKGILRSLMKLNKSI